MIASKKSLDALRSAKWYGPNTVKAFYHRSRTKQMGFSESDYRGKPVIAIVNTWSEMNPCHIHFRERAEDVKRGVWLAGGFPVEMPAMSLGEIFMKPTAMMYRNMLAMEVEELLRANPIDGAILLGGCDKTVPAMIMGAASASLPFIFVPAGPMLRGNWRGRTLGSGTDTSKFYAELRAGTISQEDFTSMEEGSARSYGTCMTMGTASTMASVAETLGVALPYSAATPAVDSSHRRMASDAGRAVVELVWRDILPKDIMTEKAFDNAITAMMALGGSTNGIIHLVAMAKRVGINLPLQRFDAISRTTPFLANISPSGKYLMEDFFYAGGLPALLKQLGSRLNLDCVGVNLKTLGANIADAKVWNDDVIRPIENALSPEGGLAVLTGNLAPTGAVIKQTAADQALKVHRGPAVVFSSYQDLLARIDDPDLDVTANSVLVMQNCGPQGGPGMPEWGQLPLPKKLLAKGVRDMVRVSDARMSGTTFGACVLHVSPEAFVGGPLAFVRDGDMIELNVPERRIKLEVSDAELAARREAWTPPKPKYERSYGQLFSQHVTQANEGCDFDFLSNVSPVAEPQV